MKKFSLLVIVAAVAMVSCSNTYEGKTVELTNMNDSVNYALGLVNANGIKMQQFRNIDSTEYKAATTAFMDGLIKGYETEVQEEPSEIQGVAQNIGYAVKEMEKSGLANNPAWAINEKLFFQGLVNAINNEFYEWPADSATKYFRAQYQASTNLEKGDLKPIKAKCPNKVAPVTLKNASDSINYAFGLLNGQQIAMYVLSGDTTGTGKDEFIKELNAIVKTRQDYPQLAKIGQQIGSQIKAQEATGLIGIEALTTDFELIKQGFINGFVEYGDWDVMMANGYIQEAVNELQYGNAKREGIAFLEERTALQGHPRGQRSQTDHRRQGESQLRRQTHQRHRFRQQLHTRRAYRLWRNAGYRRLDRGTPTDARGLRVRTVHPLQPRIWRARRRSFYPALFDPHLQGRTPRN